MNTMQHKSVISSFVLTFLLSACVTINIYFPAAAAEDAARVIVRDVLDEEGEVPDSSTTSEETSYKIPVTTTHYFATALLDVLISYYASGAVGLTANAAVQVRDLATIPLKDRNQVKKLVADENRDRSALYAEIARANNHPEWEADIRATFARVWVEEVPGGTWYQAADGSWAQK